ncbi:MAG: hypothetical protein K2J81_06280 [Treponemataceae bacterium]|nr:hypothetical protein [Treponemataceae bacterium]
MMKKLSKIALLAAASAFMLAVFPACGDDDGDDDPKATLAAEAVELEIGAEKTVEATVTVENDTFSDNAQKIQQGEPIPKAYFELKATDATKVTVSEATVKAWDGKTKATITFTVTAAEGAAAGKISAEIKAGTLTSNATLTTTGNIAYTINGAGDEQGGDDDPSPKVVTYNFDDITETSDNAGATSVLDGKVVVNQTTAGKIKITAETDGSHHYIQASCGASSALAPLASGTTGYLAVKAAKAGKEKITFTFTTVKGSSVSNNQIVLYDAVDGTQIGISDIIECPTSDSKEEKTLTIEATVPETFYVTFIRSAGKGGFKFSKIEQEY